MKKYRNLSNHQGSINRIRNIEDCHLDILVEADLQKIFIKITLFNFFKKKDTLRLDTKYIIYIYIYCSAKTIIRSALYGQIVITKYVVQEMHKTNRLWRNYL